MYGLKFALFIFFLFIHLSIPTASACASSQLQTHLKCVGRQWRGVLQCWFIWWGRAASVWASGSSRGEGIHTGHWWVNFDVYTNRNTVCGIKLCFYILNIILNNTMKCNFYPAALWTLIFPKHKIICADFTLQMVVAFIYIWESHLCSDFDFSLWVLNLLIIPLMRLSSSPLILSYRTGGGKTGRKILRFVDKIAKSKYFQKATENEFIKKKFEEMSNTPLLLTVEVQELSGTLVINIPPPPTDRIW